MAWAKNRDDTHPSQVLDAVRGNNAVLATGEVWAEDDPETDYSGGGVAELLTNGIRLKSGTTSNDNLNDTGQDALAWVFNMLPAYGMDIVSYTGNGVAGRTVAHNLGADPELIIIKNRDAADGWRCGCEYAIAANPWNYWLPLNATNAADAAISVFNNTAPTSSVFTVGNAGTVNTNGENYIAYLFRSIPGFLKVGYYFGNGSTNGPRIGTDFRVRYTLIKATSAVGGWVIKDSTRNPYNVAGLSLYADTTNVEAVTNEVDFLANGFKLRNADSYSNANGARYIYLAIGDAYPYVNAF
jgi:hypothetical protein